MSRYKCDELVFDTEKKLFKLIAYLYKGGCIRFMIAKSPLKFNLNICSGK